MRCNLRALQSGDYLTVGQMLSTITVQGGAHPRIFSPSIRDYMAKGLAFCQPSIEEIPDATVRNSLKKVLSFLQTECPV